MCRCEGVQGWTGCGLSGRQMGLIDRSGSFVVKPVFDYDKGLPSAPIFFEGKACVKIDGKFGFIDKTGRPLFPPRFIKCAGFRGVCRLGFVQVTFPAVRLMARTQPPSFGGRVQFFALEPLVSRVDLSSTRWPCAVTCNSFTTCCRFGTADAILWARALIESQHRQSV